MWRLTRRDAVTVWSQDPIIKRLTRYRSIIDLKVPSRFLLARKIAVDFNQSDPTSTLWKTHDKARKQFKQVFTKIQNLDEYEAMSTPEFSFLDLKHILAEKMLENCNFCEHSCNVDRKNTTGFCGVGYDSYVSSAFLHTGEEPPLVPSGTIFFSGCNLRCAHCQNYDISSNPTNGTKVTSRQLASIADELASQGAKNINYVGGDPTPNIHTILQSLQYQQFNITQLWNSNMYLSEASMNLLIDIIDFWLPDLKYFSESCAHRISRIPNYPKIVTRNIKRAYDKGTTEMIIRVLVLPNHLECCFFPIIDWIAENTPTALVNLMAQYRPMWRVNKDPKTYADIARRVSREEMEQVYAYAEKKGLEYRSVS